MIVAICTGFLRTGPGAEGAGLLAIRDIEAALRWVRTNAAQFGGDPQRVTLLGHHTGAALVNLILLSPEAKGLLHRAVLLSGSALSPWAVQLDAERAAASVAKQLGCGDGSPVRRDLTPCLQQVSLEALLDVVLPNPAFLPRVGPPPPDVLLAGVDPERAMKEKTVGAFVNVPVVLGFTTSESVHEISAYELQWGMEEERRTQVLRTFVRNAFAWHVTEILAAVLNEYTDWSRAVQHPISLRDNVLEALTDGHTVAPLLRRIGSARGDDVAYLLGAPLVTGTTGLRALFPHNFTRQDQAVSHTMLTFLANFAKSGHYHAHRLATWLHLVPQLHRPGGDDVSPRHHHFTDIGLGPPIYAGEVRPEPYLPRPVARHPDSDEDHEAILVECVLVNDSSVASASTMQGPEDEASELLHRDTGSGQKSSFLSWPTALALTLGAGCLLLLLNILIFAAILYHRERRKEAKQKRLETSGSCELQKDGRTGSVEAMAMAVLTASPRPCKRPPPHAVLPPRTTTVLPPPSLPSALAQQPRTNPTKKRVQIQEISV
ncbi:hypothetical protein B566_EDAN002687 [Ephemera danica]|nr:hypothetical protein B566_EDAN002687 [Ephemera danica]